MYINAISSFKPISFRQGRRSKPLTNSEEFALSDLRPKVKENNQCTAICALGTGILGIFLAQTSNISPIEISDFSVEANLSENAREIIESNFTDMDFNNLQKSIAPNIKYQGKNLLDEDVFSIKTDRLDAKFAVNQNKIKMTGTVDGEKVSVTIRNDASKKAVLQIILALAMAVTMGMGAKEYFNAQARKNRHDLQYLTDKADLADEYRYPDIPRLYK